MTEKYTAPIAVDIEKDNTYSWCSCGLSSIMPLCDGTHKTADTDKKSLKFVAEKNQTAYLCACGKTGTAPFCDGSHSR